MSENKSKTSPLLDPYRSQFRLDGRMCMVAEPRRKKLSKDFVGTLLFLAAAQRKRVYSVAGVAKAWIS